MRYDYDVVVIGGGPAGQQVAYALADKKRVLIVENDLWGGTCPNRGCDPKKMLYGVVEAKRQTSLYQNKGLAGTAELTVDWPAMIDFKDSYTSKIPGATEGGLRQANIHHNRGTAKLLSNHAIDLEGEELSADKIIIATGAKAAVPNIPGAEFIEISDDFLNEKVFPEKIAIIGAGYVAIELANIAVTAGVEVHVFQRDHEILKAFPAEYTKQVADNLIQKGVHFHWNAHVTHVKKTANELEVGTDDETVAGFKHVYAATGRPANVAALDLSAAGVEMAETGGVKVNEYLQTTVENIYAIGDVAASPAPKLTPVAGIEGRYVAKLISGEISEPIHYPTIAQLIFAGPELGQVSVSLDVAKKNPADYETMAYDLSGWYTYNRIQDASAQATIVVNHDSGMIVGATVLATNAEELLNYFAEMIANEHTSEDLSKWVPVYPSAASDLQYLYE